MMLGLITERDLERADDAFPGILRFFESLPEKPRTFLHLMALFHGWCGTGESGTPPRATSRKRSTTRSRSFLVHLRPVRGSARAGGRPSARPAQVRAVGGEQDARFA